ncbi:unnamed protein product [Rotaria sp. Silwood1]|nr:unnamed protein product [Rotaria sp. Silwood1]CAF5044503.1 unnamed protein product [Rotaria sp. Silwood1]
MINDDNDDSDKYSDTHDEVMFEVQRYIVYIDRECIQLPDDIPPKFDNYLNSELLMSYLKNKRRIQGSEDWTDADDQHLSIETNDESNQILF